MTAGRAPEKLSAGRAPTTMASKSNSGPMTLALLLWELTADIRAVPKLCVCVCVCSRVHHVWTMSMRVHHVWTMSVRAHHVWTMSERAHLCLGQASMHTHKEAGTNGCTWCWCTPPQGWETGRPDRAERR